MKINTQEFEERTPLEWRIAERLKGAAVGECLSFEQIMTLAREGRRAPNYYAQMQHVISCPACRQAVLQARALVEARRPSLARWLQRFALPRPLVWAPALGIGALAFLFLWRGSDAPQTQIASQPPTSSGEPSVVVASSEQPDEPQSEIRTPDSAPQLVGTRVKPPSDTPERPRTPAEPTPSSQRELQIASRMPAFVGRAVELLNQSTALFTRSVPAPATPWLQFAQPDLQRNGSVPAGTERFQWSSVADAENYRLTIRRTDGDTVADASLNAEQTRYTLDAPLPAGRYEIVLTVVAAGGETRTMRRRFYVLNAEQQERYEWARRNANELPLLSAAVFMQIDRYEDALRSIERAAQKYPDDEQVEQWRRLIQTRLNQRTGEFSQ